MDSLTARNDDPDATIGNGGYPAGMASWGGVRAYAFVRYCERGSHTVSDESLRKVAAAVQMD